MKPFTQFFSNSFRFPSFLMTLPSPVSSRPAHHPISTVQHCLYTTSRRHFKTTMSKPGKSVATDPESYTSKDLLLLTQLLHGQGLIDPTDVTSSILLSDIANEWFNHKSTQLSRSLNEFPLSKAPSGQQVLRLYENMLAANEKCANTTDLANSFYFARMEELENKLAQDKERFKELLEEN